MKKSLLIAFLLIPFLSIAQTTKPVDGFLGIKFGSTKQEVIAAMQAKQAKYEEASSKESFLQFSNVTVAHRAAHCFVRFIDGKAYEALFNFFPESEPQIIEYYNALVTDISGAYGPGKAIVDFKDPYKFGDGNESVALAEGNAKMFTNWKSDNGNTMQVKISKNQYDNLYVSLFYTDETLNKEVLARQKAKDKADL